VSLNARRAARLAVDAICAGKAEKILGVPAQILSRAQTLLPGLTSELLQLANAWLPRGNSDSVLQTGRELENELGPLYRLVTAFGRQAGHGLNQKV
jgi:hypothetical protein